MRGMIALLSAGGMLVGLAASSPKAMAAPLMHGALMPAAPASGLLHNVDDDDDDGRPVRRRVERRPYRVGDDDDADGHRVRRYRRAPDSHIGIERAPARAYVPRRGDDDDDD